ncbi:MAG: PhoH family protein [Acidimicrobiales bacterium]|nr:PhoH family protein [Acidimicrobiales bacterium]
MAQLLGHRDENLDAITRALDVDVHARGNEITVDGADAQKAAQILNELVLLVEKGEAIEPAQVRRAVTMVAENQRPSDVFGDRVITTARGKTVRAKTAGQKRYLDAIRSNMVTFGIGPAGTGKSWLAVACAVRSLQNREVERILLTRPAVEAGERLGYLPGDLLSKVDPYLRPLYDALQDMVGAEGLQKLFERDAVEVAPLAFMRGRTLNDSFVILDEAQNTTPEQMKMFLTRIGFGSKVVVTGDETQVDVDRGRSGLRGTEKILTGVEGLEFVRLSSADVVRHRIVQDIVDAYERSGVTNGQGRDKKR